jgi:hypothetical protein
LALLGIASIGDIVAERTFAVAYPTNSIVLDRLLVGIQGSP